MNYIKHLGSFFDKISEEQRLNPNHVSLYVSLFQFWNMNYFKNPISVSRSEIMKFCKIGSKHTYHKCLRDLHDLGLIAYHPSHNPIKGSLVYLFNIGTSTELVKRLSSVKSGTSSEQLLVHKSDKNGTSREQVLAPSINSIINNTNNKLNKQEREEKNCARKKNDENYLIEKKSNSIQENTTSSPALLLKEKGEIQNAALIETMPVLVKDEIQKEKKVAPKKEKEFYAVPGNMDEVINYFKEHRYASVEAEKFYHHFESNGWKVSGRAPMKNWQAAARKWMLSINDYSKQSINKTIHVNNDKDYSIPL